MANRYVTAPAALRRCFHCGKYEDEQLKLRRCAGCSSAVYCSKECQKKEWSTHKPLCNFSEKRHDTEARVFGFRDENELSSALRDFIMAHMLTLQSYAKAELALKGGTQYMSNPPRQLEFNLKCRCTRGSSTLDPASTFELVGSRWETIEEYISEPHNALNWEGSAASREMIQREYGSDPRYLGALPVQFAVEGFSPNSGMVFPQHRSFAPFLQAPHISGEDVRKMLADALVICVGSIRLGLALRSVEPQIGVSCAPLPGCYVRTNRRWNWEPLLTNWEQYLKGPRGIQKVDSLVGDAALQSGLAFDTLMVLFSVL